MGIFFGYKIISKILKMEIVYFSIAWISSVKVKPKPKSVFTLWTVTYFIISVVFIANEVHFDNTFPHSQTSTTAAPLLAIIDVNVQEIANRADQEVRD